MSQTDIEMAEARRLRRLLDELDRYTSDARNERADTRINDGPASELIPPGRGRSVWEAE